MTIEYFPDGFALIAGICLGFVFYGGLWWTTRQGLRSKVPSVWFGVSLLVRIAAITAGFVVVSDGHWQRSLACLAGFVLARVVAIQWTGQSQRLAIFSDPKTDDAP